MRSDVEAMLDRRAHRRPSSPGRRLYRVDRFLGGPDEEAVLTIADDLGHRSARVGDHRRSARHRLDDAEAERLVEADEMEECARAAEQLAATIGTDRADVPHPLAVETRLDGLLEVLAVLDDPGDDQRQIRRLRPPRSPRPSPSRDGSSRRTAGSRPVPPLARTRACRCRGGSSPRSRGARAGLRR